MLGVLMGIWFLLIRLGKLDCEGFGLVDGKICPLEKMLEMIRIDRRHGA